LLRRGLLAADGEPQRVCEAFFRESDDRARASIRVNTSPSVPDDEFELLSIKTFDAQGMESQIFDVGSDIFIRARFRTMGLKMPTFGFGIQTADMVRLATENTEGVAELGDLSPGEHEIECRIRAAPMLPGIFSLRFGVTEGAAARTVFYVEDLAVFEMQHNQRLATTSAVKRDGIIQLQVDWSTRNLRTGSLGTRANPSIPARSVAVADKHANQS